MTQPGPAPGYVGGRILDVGALIQVATGASVYARAVLAHANTRGQAIVVSTAALAAARAASNAAARAQLHVLLDLAPVLTVPLTLSDAEVLGDLLATTERATTDAPADLAAGHVVWLGLHRNQHIITDRPAALRAIAPDVALDELP